MAVPSPWYPLIIISFFLLLAVGILTPLMNIAQFSLFCEENGLPSNCDDKHISSKVTSWTSLVAIVSGTCTALTAGAWSAASDRLGRRGMFIISCLGILFVTGSWSLVFLYDDIKSQWKVVTLIGACAYCILGSFISPMIAIYGQIGDLTAKSPQQRASLYTVFQAIMGITGIIGAQLTAMGGIEDLPIMISSACIVSFCTLIGTIVFAHETIPNEIRKLPIAWNQANIFAGIFFCLPWCNRHSRRETNEDSVNLYARRLQEHYQVSSLTPELENHVEEVKQWVEHQHPTTDKTKDNQEALLTGVTEIDYKGQPAPVLPDPDAPKYIKHGNILVIFGIIVFLNFGVSFGFAQIMYPYIKNKYQANRRAYANVLTAYSFARAVGTFVIIPMLRKVIKTPVSEIRVVLAILLIEAGVYVGLAYSPNLYLFALCLGVASICSCICFGFARAILTNQVSNVLMKRIISLMSCIEVLAGSLCHYIYGSIYSGTNKSHPHTVVLVMAGILIFGAILIFFISDTKYDLNYRNPNPKAIKAATVIVSDANDGLGKDNAEEDNEKQSLFAETALLEDSAAIIATAVDKASINADESY